MISRVLALLLVIYCVQLGGCSLGVRDSVATAITASHDRVIPTDLKDLREELKETEDRALRLRYALKTAEDDAVQIKIWLGVGALVLAGIVLIVIGIYTTRRILVEIGLIAFGVAGLGAVTAWLVPYVLYIGLGILVIVIGVIIYMLTNREKAVKQIAQAVTASEERIPAFAGQFRKIFNEHIDSNIDNVIKTVRGVK